MSQNSLGMIILDSADIGLIQSWSDEGYLPTFKSLLQSGTTTPLLSALKFVGGTVPIKTTEHLWGSMKMGVGPQTSGYWGPLKFRPDEDAIQFDATSPGANFLDYPPFYALGESAQVAALNLPISVLDRQINGIQLNEYSAHVGFSIPDSYPTDLYDNIVRKYGVNELMHNEGGANWNRQRIEKIFDYVVSSIDQTTNVFADLLGQRKWDLYLASYRELHSATHGFWFTHDTSHPQHDTCWKGGSNRNLLRLSYERMDQALGRLLESDSGNRNWLIASLHGANPNSSDLCNNVFLPELLFRSAFPKRCAFRNDRKGPPGPQVTTLSDGTPASRLEILWSLRKHANYKRTIWDRILNRALPHQTHGPLISPFGYGLPHFQRQLVQLWYRRQWRKMPAFALPSFFHGEIRINLAGRHPLGTVRPGEYDAVCAKIASELQQVRNARTGERIVKQVVRTRENDYGDSPDKPLADLLVEWNPQPTDVVESPQLGRIGPIPYDRSAEHSEHGFLLACGQQFQPIDPQHVGTVLDIAPTVLSLMGRQIPDYYEGRPLLTVKDEPAYTDTVRN